MNIKSIKKDDVAVKFEIGTKLYEVGNINNKTFEQIAPAYRGKPQAEKFYMFSQAYYKTEQYYLAGYQFESFARISQSEKYRKLLI
jgi:outer membrane protein assembly factor BamD